MIKPLTTENLQSKFGKIDFEIIESTEESRCITLSNGGSTLVLAVSYFFQVPENLASLRKKIILGSLIGETLKRSTIDFDKCEIHKYILKLPEKIKQAFLSKPDYCLGNLYDILIMQNNIKIPFCRIFEIYDPVVNLAIVDNTRIFRDTPISQIRNMDKLIKKYNLNTATLL